MGKAAAAAVQQLSLALADANASNRVLTDSNLALTAQLGAANATIATLVAEQLEPEPPPAIKELFAEFDATKAGCASWKVNRNRVLPLVRRLGHLPASDLTPVTWAKHVSERAKEYTRFGRPPNPYVIYVVELARAKELLNFAVTMGYMDNNPLATVAPPKLLSERETWLDDDGVEQLLSGIAALPHPRAKSIMRAFVLICLDGMMRHNEARLLRRDQIRSGTIELGARSTKSKRSRIIGFTPRILKAIDEVPVVDDCPYVFANPETGYPYGKSMMQTWFRTICKESKIDALAADGERVVIHTLRHSGASGADAKGASPLAIRDCLGHASLKTTERYLHRHREAGAKDLAKLLAASTRKRRKGPQPAQRTDLHERSVPSRNGTGQ